MSGKQDNARKLNQEELSRVAGGAETAANQAGNGTPNPVDPVVPVPMPEPVPDPVPDLELPKYKCSNCGHIVRSSSAKGQYSGGCPRCKQIADWIYLGYV